MDYPGIDIDPYCRCRVEVFYYSSSNRRPARNFLLVGLRGKPNKSYDYHEDPRIAGHSGHAEYGDSDWHDRGFIRRNTDLDVALMDVVGFHEWKWK